MVTAVRTFLALCIDVYRHVQVCNCCTLGCAACICHADDSFWDVSVITTRQCCYYRALVVKGGGAEHLVEACRHLPGCVADALTSQAVKQSSKHRK